ncbi:MAG: prepilin peptidase [Spirochaetaceae bacterium]|nr:prepilin peptidase [Spirochaetaceae bacterium]
MLEYFTLFYFSIISFFLIIKDVKYLILPDKYLLLLFTGLVIFDLVFKKEIIFYHLISSIFAGLFFLIVHLITKQNLGFGDVKYSVVIGYFLGINFWIIAIFLACLCGIIIYLLGKKFHNWNKTTKIPFGPFMSISSIVVKIGSIAL